VRQLSRHPLGRSDKKYQIIFSEAFMKKTLLFFIPVGLIGIFILCIMFPDTANKFGGASTIVSFLTVLLTYIYVVLTGMMVRQMVKAQQDEDRPYILAHLEFDQNLCWIVVSNIGKKPAKGLTIKIDPPLVGLRNVDIAQKLFAKPISFFPPGKVFRSAVNSSVAMFADGSIDEYRFTISYAWDGCPNPVTEEYTVNVGFNKGRWGVDKKDLDDIANSLDSIEKHLEIISNK
jgi:hypothetical protein